MHELAIAQDFWKTIVDHARQNKLTKLTKITISLGEASGIERGFLEHSLKDHIMPGTMAADAELEIISQPLSAVCGSCGAAITTAALKELSCPVCGSRDIEISSGRETYVASIEGQ